MILIYVLQYVCCYILHYIASASDNLNAELT